MNTKIKANVVRDTTITKVVFLMTVNPDNGRREVLAYFPEVRWDRWSKDCTSYMHDGQHGACCEAFALLDCKIPNLRLSRDRAAIASLKKELEDNYGYNLEVLDSAAWVRSKRDRQLEIMRNVNEATDCFDSPDNIKARH